MNATCVPIFSGASTASLHLRLQESGGTFKFFSREKICSDYVLATFDKVISRVYSDLYFDQAAKKSAEEMIEAIRAAFDRGLVEVSWIDQKTKSLSREKVSDGLRMRIKEQENGNNN